MIINWVRLSQNRSTKLLLTFMFFISAFAEVHPGSRVDDMTKLFDRSEMVCLVDLASPVTSLQANNSKLSVDVLRSYKGIPQPKLVVNASPELIKALYGQAQGQKFFVFLQMSTESSLTLNREDVFQTRGLVSNDGNSGILQLERDSVSSLNGSLQDIPDLQFLLTFPFLDEVSETALKRNIVTDVLSVKLMSVAVLMASHKPQYAIQMLDILTTNTARISSDEAIVVASRIEQESLYIPLDILEQLSLVPILSIEMSGIQALRNRGSKQTIPTLIEHLDDPQSVTRGMAVATLAEIVPQSGIPNPTGPEFDKNPSYYVDAWKSWWLKRGSEGYGKPAK